MRTILLSFLTIFSGSILFAQDGFKVTIKDLTAVPEQVLLKSDTTLDLRFSSYEIESTFSKYEIEGFEKYSLRTKNPLLKDIYIVKTKDRALAKELLEKFPTKYTKI